MDIKEDDIIKMTMKDFCPVCYKTQVFVRSKNQDETIICTCCRYRKDEIKEPIIEMDIISEGEYN